MQESRKRHGVEKRLDRGGSTVTELAGEARAQLLGSKKRDEKSLKNEAGSAKSEEEQRLRALRGKGRKRSGPDEV